MYIRVNTINSVNDALLSMVAFCFSNLENKLNKGIRNAANTGMTRTEPILKLRFNRK